MNLEHYQYQTSADFLEYEFESTGPKGTVIKLVRFEKIPNRIPTTYNLGFGDLDPITGMVNDLVETNNDDRDIVLATVVSTIISFTNIYKDCLIYSEGSTLSRTRLYRICITKYIDEINQDFEVWGFIDNQFVVFQPNVNYEGFLVKRKY